MLEVTIYNSLKWYYIHLASLKTKHQMQREEFKWGFFKITNCYSAVDIAIYATDLIVLGSQVLN